MANITINVDALQRLMGKNCLTNLRLAEAAGLSEGTIKRILKGYPTTRTTASLLAAAFDVTVDELVSGVSETDEEEPEEVTVEEAVKALEKIYLDRIEDLKAMIAHTRKEFRVAAAVAILLAAFVCFLFAYDIMNPTVGWIQR